MSNRPDDHGPDRYDPAGLAVRVLVAVALVSLGIILAVGMSVAIILAGAP